MAPLPASLQWAHLENQEEDIPPFVAGRLRQVFGQGGNEVNVTKIAVVQKKLHREALHRDPALIQQVANECDGHAILMVDAPYPLPCTAAAPCLHENACVSRVELPEGAACQDRSPQSITQLPLDQLRLFAQCHSPAQAAPVSMHEIKAAPADPAVTDPAADPAAADPADAAADPAPPAPPAPLRCPVCNHGTAGGCLHAITGDCAPFNDHGVCPPDHAPCRPNPCPDVRAPCYDPASPPAQPVCVSKEEARCRVLDPTGNVCLSHACPPGTVESQSTRWQAAFYPDGKRYDEGLYDNAFLLEPGDAGPNDPQVWVPPGSNVVLPTSLGGPHAHQGFAAGTGGWAVLARQPDARPGQAPADGYWTPHPYYVF